jgi:hypothetical protein
MYFKSLEAFNMAMLVTQAWKIFMSPGYLITLLLKARHFPISGYFASSIRTTQTTFGGAFGALSRRFREVSSGLW